MSSEGATPEIAVDIDSIDCTAAESEVQDDILNRNKQSSKVPDSDAYGREEPQTSTRKNDMLDQEGEITAVPETKEFNSEYQKSRIPDTDTDAVPETKECQAADLGVGNTPGRDLPVQSLDPPPGLESWHITKYSTYLFRAALRGDWRAVMLISVKAPVWLRTGITKGGETIVHIAAAAKHLQVVEALVSRDPDSLLYTNKDGSTPFCFAAVSGVVEIARTMHKQNNELPNIRGKQGMTPLHMAVLLGHRAMVCYLLEVTDDKRLTNQDLMEILTSCIDTDMFDIASRILEKNLHLALRRDARDETALHALARKPLKLGGHRPSIQKIFSGSYTCTGEETEEALKLAQILWNQVIQQKEEDISVSISHPWRLLFVAARLGKVEFLTLLIQSYPDLLWKVDENGYSIFHMAVIHRHAEIFTLIYEIGAIKDLIATYKDKMENNMLHLASRLAPLNRLSCVSGAALQMQRELQWFEAVQQIVRPEYTEAKNKDGKTAQALFSKQHNVLRRQGEEWMKKAAESCALVAVLIAAMVFTAAFQLPGGVNSKGSPVLVKRTPFVVFAMSNAVSLFTSTASILVFLSILTSRYAERDFLISLPRKFMTGLILLHISLATMVVSFTVTFVITFLEGLRWPPITIGILASVPVTLFALQQFPLLVEMYNSTYKSQNVLLPGKKKLFQVPFPEDMVPDLRWLNPNTLFTTSFMDHDLKNLPTGRDLKSYLPTGRHLTDSDIYTMLCSEGYVSPEVIRRELSGKTTRLIEVDQK